MRSEVVPGQKIPDQFLPPAKRGKPTETEPSVTVHADSIRSDRLPVTTRPEPLPAQKRLISPTP